MPSNHLILCRPLFLLPSIFPSIRVFSDESAFPIRWPKYWSFNFNISPSNEHSGLISFRMDWLHSLAVKGTLKSLLQHQSSKASVLQHWVFFTVQLSHPYMNTEKTIPLTAAAAKSLQSCPTLCDPIDSSPQGSPVPGILQARILEWIVISFSNAWKWKMKVKSLGHVQLLATMDLSPPGSSIHGFIQARVLEWIAIAFSLLLIGWTFVGKVMSLLFNMLSRLVITFLPRSSVQFSSVQSLSRVWFFRPHELQYTSLPVHHQLPEFTQTHAHWVGDAIQPSHPLSSAFPPAPNSS